jgi:hypothetical protein
LERLPVSGGISGGISISGAGSGSSTVDLSKAHMGEALLGRLSDKI